MLLRKPLCILFLVCLALLVTACSSQPQEAAQPTATPEPSLAAGSSAPLSPSVPPVTESPSPEPTAAPTPTAEPIPQAILPQTILELKETAPERFTYAGDAATGKARMEAPVILPDASALPIQTLRKKTFSSADLPGIAKLLSGDEKNKGLEASIDIFGTLIGIHSADARQKTAQSPKSGYSIIFPDTRELQPQNNPVPPDVPFARASALLGALFPDARFYLASQTATGGGHLVKTGVVGLSDEQLLSQAPYPGFEMGYYALVIGQTLNGAPVFTENYFAVASENEPLDATARFRVSPFFDERRLSMEGSVLTPVSTLIEDAALAPYAQIQQVIQARIQSGHILSVDSMALGYMLYYAQPTSMLEAAQGADMVAIPTWEVVGEMAFDPREAGAPILENHRFRIDALTGRPLDDYASPAPRAYPVSGLLP